MVGFYDNFTPKFVKKYANVGEIMVKAFAEYAQDVRQNKFPIDGEHTYGMKEEEIKELQQALFEAEK